jgi:hypothetical protein
MLSMKLVYLANIIVADWISLTSMFAPRIAVATIFSNVYPGSDVIRLVGCLWLGIAVLSVLGLFRPVTFAPVFLIQLIYKGSWLLLVALPAIRAGENYPSGMAAFFLIWVLVLPWVMPWSTWWG